MRLLVSALEHSANIHLKSVTEHLDDVELVGIFDKNLGNSIVDLQELAIMGFIDAIKKLRYFFHLADEMVKLAADVDKVLLIDSSGFNLPLAKKIKKAYPNKEIIYYILPQAWAWRRGRIKVLERTIDKLCSILPFERDYYSPNAPIKYVGHPLLDQIDAFKSTINPQIKHIAFLAGSRAGEITKLMPIFRELQNRLNIDATLVIPRHFSATKIDELYGDISNFNISNNAHKVLKEVDFAYICSGTATLEASIIGTPFALVYIANKFDYFIAKNLVKLDYIGLANIMFSSFKNRPIHSEFIQDDVNVNNLLDELEKCDRERFIEDSINLRKYLAHGSSKNVARIINAINFIPNNAKNKGL